MPEFKPYVPHDSTEREFTLEAALAGIVMAAVFGAANAYLGMKAGQTVAATIPAAVIAIALFRLASLASVAVCAPHVLGAISQSPASVPPLGIRLPDI